MFFSLFRIAGKIAHDLLGRNTHILYSDPTQNVPLTYDSGTGANLLGRLASVTDTSGLLEYSYDDNGNVEIETRTINSMVFVTSYNYDDAGNLRTMTYPTGHIIESYFSFKNSLGSIPACLRIALKVPSGISAGWLGRWCSGRFAGCTRSHGFPGPVCQRQNPKPSIV